MIKKWIDFIKEEFTQDTIDINNTEYLKYYNRNKDISNSRERMVAWDAPRSQTVNFDMVSKYIRNGDSVLDYGCGIGDFIKYIGEKKKISKYLGVDINPQFIETAIESYPDNDFQLIKSVDDINGKFDVICAIGVFTWYITKEDFINTINKLHEKCNKSVVLTCLYDSHIKLSNESESDRYWKSTYRKYNKGIFKKLFPDLKIKFGYDDSTTMIVIIEK